MPTVDPDDLTARARIRDAALREFGEKGFDGATIRGIALRADVSSGLLRHHFGSKQELREACDEYLVKVMRALNDETLTNVERGDVHYVSARMQLGPYQAYITRSLVDGSASELFDALVAMTEEWLASADAARIEPPPVERRARAAVITAMALSIPILQQHVSRGLGMDIDTPEGDLRLASTLVDIYSNPLMTHEQAKSAQADLERRTE